MRTKQGNERRRNTNRPSAPPPSKGGGREKRARRENSRSTPDTEKKPGRLEDPDKRTGTEWTAPEPDPNRDPRRESPRREEPDPERKVFGRRHDTGDNAGSKADNAE